MIYNIYAPVLNNTQEAFTIAGNSNDYKIKFILPATVAQSDIKCLRIKVTYQKNNKSIVNNTLYPDGIIYKNYENNMSEVSILNTDLSEQWQAGTIYKFQLQFGGRAWNSDTESYRQWKTKCVEEGSFSEWSNVMIAKAIIPPSISFNFEDIFQLLPTDLPGNPQVKLSNHYPEFKVNIIQNTTIQEAIENIKSYQYILNKENDDTFVLESPLFFNETQQFDFKYTFKEELQPLKNDQYIATFKAITVNGFQLSKSQRFDILPTSKSTDTNPILSISIKPNHEEAFMEVSVAETANKTILNCAIVRANEKTNYSIWERVANIDLYDGNYEYSFKDYTIESGVNYKYKIFALHNDNYIQYLSAEIEKPEAVHFQYNYLYYNGIQLPLKFNNKMSSFKKTILATKTDTIGSQYPTIVRNGYVNYAEFPITGLVSITMDDAETFFCWKTIDGKTGYYYNNELIISSNVYDKDNISTPRDKTPNDDTFKPPLSLHNLTNENIFIERKFREKVEEFLNDGKPKLFKSATEGNFIVSLINISFTPNQQLGRMIAEFTSTAYEIGEYNLNNLVKYNIHIIQPSNMNLYSEDDKTIVGQYSGLSMKIPSVPDTNVSLSAPTLTSIRQQRNIKQLIEDHISRQLDTESEDYTFSEIESIWIDNFPILTSEDVEIEKRKSQLFGYQLNDEYENMTKDKYLSQIRKQAEYALIYEHQNIGDNEILTLNGDFGQKRYVKLNKKYQNNFLYPDTISFSSSHPLVLNYIAKAKKQYLKTITYPVGGYDIDVIGQINGVFTNDHMILSLINPFYDEIEVNTKIPNMMLEGTNIKSIPSYYNTYDILSLIKNNVKNYIRDIYQKSSLRENPYIDNDFLIDDTTKFEFTHNNVKYEFNYEIAKYKFIEIETQPHTKIIINGNSVYVNETGIYRLIDVPADTTIKFDSNDNKAPEAIISYCVSTTQELVVG